MRPHRLYIDIGSTYFKLDADGAISHHFRDFSIPIYDDLRAKCGEILARYTPEEISICSSANGGLSTLVIALSDSFSLRYAINTAFNAGINIIDTLTLPRLAETAPPSQKVDVVVLTGGIDGVGGLFDERICDFLANVRYDNIVYAGNDIDAKFLASRIPELVVLPNLLNDRLKLDEKPLKTYLTDLYQADIMGKEEIKRFYDVTANQIYPTPYVVNRALPLIGEKMAMADPFVVVDIGGATTDIHYSTDLVADNLVGEGGYDRLVFKKLGVYKSRPSLLHTARQNEFVFELLGHLGVTEEALESREDTPVTTMMQLALFLVLYKVSRHHADYVELDLAKLNTIVLTGGIAKILSPEEAKSVVTFAYRKLLHFHQAPDVVLDTDYRIWTYGMEVLARQAHTKERS
ncbi:glutamate mutase L [Hydrogenimonas sp.]